MKRITSMIVTLMCLLSAVSAWGAETGDSARSSAGSSLLMPLVFDGQQSVAPGGAQSGGAQWIGNAFRSRHRTEALRYRMMIDNPSLVRFNVGTLPAPPKEVVVEIDPAGNQLEVVPGSADSLRIKPVDRRELKVHNWLHTFAASLHGTQAYISSNWYQGGENNLNLLADLQWDFNLNQKLHPKWLFNNTLRYKLGIATAKGDSLRSYSVNEDNFQFNSQLGYKAIKNWYYSATFLFKTQLLNNYVTNTRNLAASFLSSGEMNVGLGMTYNYKDKDGYKVFSLSVAPLSYNLKICRDIVKLDPTKFGINAGHHTKHSFGSNLEAKWEWKITPSISWTSRLYVFTNYDYLQGDWENKFTFSVSSHLDTQIFTHLRYDKSRPWNKDWKYWQFKEILSFGLTYRFATK